MSSRCCATTTALELFADVTDCDVGRTAKDDVLWPAACEVPKFMASIFWALAPVPVVGSGLSGAEPLPKLDETYG